MTKRKFTPPTNFPAEYMMGDGTRVTLLAKGVGDYPYVGQHEKGFVVSYTKEGSYDKDWGGSPTDIYDLHDIPKTSYVEELEAKLAKAVEALRSALDGAAYIYDGTNFEGEYSDELATLAELSSVSCANTTGGKDD